MQPASHVHRPLAIDSLCLDDSLVLNPPLLALCWMMKLEGPEENE